MMPFKNRRQAFARAALLSVLMLLPAPFANAQSLGAEPARQEQPAESWGPTAGQLGPTARRLNRLGSNVPRPKPRSVVRREIVPVTATPTPRKNRVEVNRSRQAETVSEKPIAETSVNGQLERASEGISKEHTECLARLTKLAVFERVTSPETTDSHCIIDNPVAMKATLGNAPVGFPAEVTLDCPFAVSFANFTTNVIQPLAQNHLKRSVTALSTGNGFVCRRRNNAASGKLSEHAFGNAVDIVAFRLSEGPNLQVKLEALMAEDEARFQSALRKSACGYFTTVLGPGSNAAHATHLHFDLGRSKDRKNPYRICE